MIYQLKDWMQTHTTGAYPKESLMLWKSLGEGAGGIVILTPEGKFFLEEIPQYGGEPREHGTVKSVQAAIEIMKGWT